MSPVAWTFPLTVLKAIGPPGSLGCLVLCVAIALLLRRRRPAVARLWLAAVAVAYLVLSLPIVAAATIGLLPAYSAAEERPNEPLDVLVVLDGDNYTGRAAEAGRIYRRAAPARVIVSGEDWFVRRVIGAGVPLDRIERESDSRTTREQMFFLRDLQARQPRQQVAAIASRLQAPRIAALAMAMGFRLDLRPSPTDPEVAAAGVRRFIPRYRLSAVAGDALYEWVALAYYRRQGWI